MDVCTCITESLCWTAEIITFKINYNETLKNKKKIVKEKKSVPLFLYENILMRNLTHKCFLSVKEHQK